MKSQNNDDNNNDNNEHFVENDLKKIREQQGITIAEVAERLKLTSTKIIKLENNDFQDMGSYTYVRGYLQYYAEMLGVDPKRYVDLVPKIDIQLPLVNTSSSVSSGLKFKRQSKSMANYALGTFILFVLGFSGWFVLKNYSANRLSQTDSIEIVDNNIIEIESKQDNDNNITDDKGQQDSEGFHYSSIIPSTNEKNLEAGTPSIDENRLPNEVNEQVDDLKDELNQNEDLIPNSQLDNTSVDQVDIPELPTQSVANDNYTIKIVAKKDSWVKVEHLSGHRIYNNLLKVGEITLTSKEPVHFRIGNGKNISITINNKSLDLPQYTQKDVIDFNWPLAQ